MASERILATYFLETPHDVEYAATIIAGEQSSGTFLPVPGETEELKARARARVEKITILGETGTPSLPGSKPPKGTATPRYSQAEIVLSFPFENIGANLPTLIATVCGNLYELSEHSGLKLRDVELPAAFGNAYPMPQFGIEGTRKLAGVHDRPLLGTIVKPSVGLSPQQTADLVLELAEAGIDFVKDDELMANPPNSLLKDRVQAVMKVVNAHADKTGKKVMFAFNVTDDLDKMLEHHDTVLSAGGTCIMVSLNSVGYPALTHLRRHSQLPIHGHRNGWGMLTRHPALGIEFSAYQKFWRLAGADHLHVNGFQNKFWEPDESVAKSIEACQTPMFGNDTVMPVISSGQWAGQIPATFERVGSPDFMFLAGGGIMAHPSGPAAGMAAIRQAWDAAAANISLETYADTHSELKQAMEKYGKLR